MTMAMTVANTVIEAMTVGMTAEMTAETTAEMIAGMTIDFPTAIMTVDTTDPDMTVTGMTDTEMTVIETMSTAQGRRAKIIPRDHPVKIRRPLPLFWLAQVKK